MKCSFILLVTLCTLTSVMVAGTARSQHLDKVKIPLQLKHSGIKEGLLSIQKAGKVQFSLPDELLAKYPKDISVDLESISIRNAIELVLSKTNLRYRIVNNFIVIEPKPVQQQPGKVYGKVLDDKGEAMPGASIRIKELNRTVSSAVDGSYSISVTPGTYTLEVSYVSYQTKQISGVLVKSDELTKLDIVLNSSSNALKGVTIQSSFKKEAIAGLYAQQKNAAGITDGISAEQIASTPDNNIGQVLKRVSGVSVVDNRYIVVRGLTERYNQGMIDGIVLPSTDMNRRNFSFDVIPAEMVSNVVINKTATPDVSAEFAGGQVSVNTLDIPLANFLIVSAGTGFNTNTLGKDFTQAGKRGKYDFLGFDDGHRKLPDGIQSWGSGTVPEYAVPQSKLFSSDAFRIYNSTGGMNQNYRLSAGQVYNLKNDQHWGFVAGLSLRNTQESSDFQDVRGMTYYASYPDKPLALIDTAYGRRNGNIYRYKTAVGAQFNTGIQGKNYKIGFKNLFSQIFNNTYTASTGSLSIVNPLNESRTKRVIQDPELTQIFQHKLEGEHTLTEGGLKLTWMGALNSVKQELKDRTRFSYYLTGTQDGVEYFQNPRVTIPGENETDYDYRMFTTTKETDYNWALHLSQPFDFLGDKSLFKMGYNGINKKRSLDATKLKIFSDDRAFDGFGRSYVELMAPENIGNGLNQAYYFADGNNGQQFDGKSSFHAGYLMLDQRFFNHLRLVYGIRAEKYDLRNRQLDDKTVIKPTGEKNTVYLPSANLTYSITPKMNFRASFSKTILRPDFRETSFFGFYDPILNADIEGANVQSTKISNTDLRYEWYPSPGEMISVSGFYKSFDKPVELVAGLDGFQSRVYRFQNQKDATNYGLEMEIRKSLGFIAAKQWLQNITLFGNGTVIRSNVHTLSYEGTNRETIVENKETRALYGQSPYTINAGVSYTAPDYGFTLSYNTTARRTYTISSDPNLTEYENGRAQIDLQLFCRLLKRKMEVKLNIANLLDSEALYYINGNGYNYNENHTFSPKYGKDKYEKEFDDVRYRVKYGINSNLSINYKF